jgi:hypothetical protein
VEKAGGWLTEHIKNSTTGAETAKKSKRKRTTKATNSPHTTGWLTDALKPDIPKKVRSNILTVPAPTVPVVRTEK